MVSELMLYDNTDMEINKYLNFRENGPLLQVKNQNTNLADLSFFIPEFHSCFLVCMLTASYRVAQEQTLPICLFLFQNSTVAFLCVCSPRHTGWRKNNTSIT